ncbi:unnamed protein product [Notodromas monacha]|uniref:Uncharacterized protein n=1 Tax=Notodromas monacha TaxID=399045 RepID=A0A7R9BGD0_9CRUS|nr:unnamed protein product [Notodromas monacha]CAG0914109.1 unnamed protein product [Notodromas monacha]
MSSLDERQLAELADIFQLELRQIAGLRNEAIESELRRRTELLEELKTLLKRFNAQEAGPGHGPGQQQRDAACRCFRPGGGDPQQQERHLHVPKQTRSIRGIWHQRVRSSNHFTPVASLGCCGCQASTGLQGPAVATTTVADLLGVVEATSGTVHHKLFKTRVVEARDAVGKRADVSKLDLLQQRSRGPSGKQLHVQQSAVSIDGSSSSRRGHRAALVPDADEWSCRSKGSTTSRAPARTSSQATFPPRQKSCYSYVSPAEPHPSPQDWIVPLRHSPKHCYTQTSMPSIFPVQSSCYYQTQQSLDTIVPLYNNRERMISPKPSHNHHNAVKPKFSPNCKPPAVSSEESVFSQPNLQETSWTKELTKLIDECLLNNLSGCEDKQPKQQQEKNVESPPPPATANESIITEKAPRQAAAPPVLVVNKDQIIMTDEALLQPAAKIHSEAAVQTEVLLVTNRPEDPCISTTALVTEPPQQQSDPISSNSRPDFTTLTSTRQALLVSAGHQQALLQSADKRATIGTSSREPRGAMPFSAADALNKGPPLTFETLPIDRHLELKARLEAVTKNFKIPSQHILEARVANKGMVKLKPRDVFSSEKGLILSSASNQDQQQHSEKLGSESASAGYLDASGGGGGGGFASLPSSREFAVNKSQITRAQVPCGNTAVPTAAVPAAAAVVGSRRRRLNNQLDDDQQQDESESASSFPSWLDRPRNKGVVLDGTCGVILQAGDHGTQRYVVTTEVPKLPGPVFQSQLEQLQHQHHQHRDNNVIIRTASNGDLSGATQDNVDEDATHKDAPKLINTLSSRTHLHNNNNNNSVNDWTEASLNQLGNSLQEDISAEDGTLTRRDYLAPESMLDLMPGSSNGIRDDHQQQQYRRRRRRSREMSAQMMSNNQQQHHNQDQQQQLGRRRRGRGQLLEAAAAGDEEEEEEEEEAAAVFLARSHSSRMTFPGTEHWTLDDASKGTNLNKEWAQQWGVPINSSDEEDGDINDDDDQHYAGDDAREASYYGTGQQYVPQARGAAPAEGRCHLLSASSVSSSSQLLSTAAAAGLTESAFPYPQTLRQARELARLHQLATASRGQRDADFDPGNEADDETYSAMMNNSCPAPSQQQQQLNWVPPADGEARLKYLHSPISTYYHHHHHQSPTTTTTTTNNTTTTTATTTGTTSATKTNNTTTATDTSSSLRMPEIGILPMSHHRYVPAIMNRAVVMPPLGHSGVASLDDEWENLLSGDSSVSQTFAKRYGIPQLKPFPNNHV